MDNILSMPVFAAENFREEGYLQEANRLFFHPLGLALVQVGDAFEVRDSRDDPEGVIFASVAHSRLRGEAAMAIERDQSTRARARVDRFGWYIQPITEEGNIPDAGMEEG